MTQTINSPATQAIPRSGSRRRQTIAALLGERSYDAIEWRKLLQDGVVVRLHVRRCRFTTRLVLEDIGVRVEDATVRDKLATWLILGEKRLLPETYMKALSRIESSARYALKERAFRTELGAFVPSTAYEGWKEITLSLRDEYFALRDQIIANHRDLVRQVLSEYESIAQDTYQRLHATHPELVTESRAQFIANYCNRIAAEIPSPERIRETFDFRFILVEGLSQLGLPSPEMTNEHEEHEAMSSSVDAMRAQVDARERQRSVLAHDLRMHAKERVDTMLDSFLESVVGQLRSLTYDAVCDVLAGLQRRERISPRSIVQLNNLLSHIRSLNFYGDTEIERIMQQIEEIVEESPAERERSMAEIQQTLRAIATVTRSTLLDLEEEPRSARDLAVPDIPTEASVRQARAELGLDLEMTHVADLLQAHADVRTQRAEVSESGMQPLWTHLESEPHRVSRAG
jgi:hypothetical protein